MTPNKSLKSKGLDFEPFYEGNLKSTTVTGANLSVTSM